MSTYLESKSGISQRQRALKVRAERAERVARELLVGLPEAHIAIDRECRIAFANPEAQRVNRKPAHAFVGQKVWDIWPELVGTIETHPCCSSR